MRVVPPFMRNGFPFGIPTGWPEKELKPGSFPGDIIETIEFKPFTEWDGSTVYDPDPEEITSENIGLIGLPSAMGDKYRPVFGEGSLFCLCLSFPQLTEFYWRMRAGVVILKKPDYFDNADPDPMLKARNWVRVNPLPYDPNNPPNGMFPPDWPYAFIQNGQLPFWAFRDFEFALNDLGWGWFGKIEEGRPVYEKRTDATEINLAFPGFRSPNYAISFRGANGDAGGTRSFEYEYAIESFLPNSSNVIYDKANDAYWYKPPITGYHSLRSQSALGLGLSQSICTLGHSTVGPVPPYTTRKCGPVFPFTITGLDGGIWLTGKMFGQIETSRVWPYNHSVEVDTTGVTILIDKWWPYALGADIYGYRDGVWDFDSGGFKGPRVGE